MNALIGDQTPDSGEGLCLLAYRRGGTLLLGFGAVDGERAGKYCEPDPNSLNCKGGAVMRVCG